MRASFPIKPHLQRLLALLGPQALLLPVKKCTKKLTSKWGNLTITDMSDPKHRAKLNHAANIGVALGKVSNGLCSIDSDEDGLTELFLKLNSMLGDTLQTKKVRRCNFWGAAYRWLLKGVKN